MLIQNHIPIFGTPEPSAVEQIVRTMEANEAVYGALMANHHKGYGVPIGGVVGYRNAISPSGVGYDIGCGNKAVRLDIPAEEVRANIGKIMDDVWSTISFGVGRVLGRMEAKGKYKNGGLCKRTQSGSRGVEGMDGTSRRGVTGWRVG